MPLELSIVMPCLNEFRTLPVCIRKAQRYLRDSGIDGEIVVADNGSTDGSVEAARALGARVVPVPVRGYGAALAAGIDAAHGRFVIMGDSDDSYDFLGLAPFVEQLRAGYDLVMGNRFRVGIEAGAMPPMHRYFGNPALSAFGRLLYRHPTIGDFYCGLRGFRKEAVQRLDLQSQGMEFALEMIVKAGMHGLRITEVPTTLAPDGRDRRPHLRTYRDGWRSLRLFLIMNPRWLFAVPGGALLGLGLVVFIALLPGPLQVGGVTFDYHTLLFAGAAVVLGAQALFAAVFAKLVAVETGLHPPLTRLGFLERRQVFEVMLLGGVGLGVFGVLLGMWATSSWSEAGFGALEPTATIRVVASSILMLLLGGITILGGCFLGIFNLVAARRDVMAARQAGRRAAVERARKTETVEERWPEGAAG